MTDEKVIDAATFLGAALLGAILFYEPQITALYADNPTNALIVGIIMMTLSNIGSRFAINQVKASCEIEDGA